MTDTDPVVRPDLSVIIASFNAQRTIIACLESLRNQQTGHTYEVIVVDSSTDGTPDLIRQHFPHVKLVSSPDRLFPGKARNVAISAARADIVASIDADCQAEPDWVEQLIQAHQSPRLIVGGPIGCANPQSFAGWVYYFCELSQWMPGTRASIMVDLPAANTSYKRVTFERYGQFLGTGYCSDTEMHWRVGKDGQQPLFVPSAIVHHNNPPGFAAQLRHHAFHGRSFARVRTRYQGFSLARCLAYLMISPIIPVRIFGKIVRNNLANRIYLHKFLVVWPLVAVGAICWSLGEAVGYAESLVTWLAERDR